jgi:diguanylate cyclase (GGDEF)-like protein/PAS domain S-box-containing protein/excisionase family DNA binding protein
VATDRAIIPSAQVDATVLRCSLDAIVTIDAHGTVLEFNPAAERMFGYARGEAVGREMAALIIPPARRDAHRNGLRRLLAGGTPRILDQRIELEAQRADGSTLPVEIAIARMSGSHATYAGFIRDLTDHKRAERERAERIARQALVVALGQSALKGMDPADLCVSGLSMLLEALGADRGVALTVDADGGLRRESAIGLGPLAGHGEPVGEAQSLMLRRTIDAGGSLALDAEQLVRLASAGLPFVAGMRCALAVTLEGDRGTTTGMLAIAAADQDAIGPDDEGFAQAIANVLGTAIARWRADAEIARLALCDPLTGLANRPLFEDRLEQALERARREQGDAAVLFVDVDGFARLNDGFGYRTGDEVLVGVGARLQAVLGERATVGRLAGDDFAVLVPGVTSDGEALAIAERIGAALSQPMLAGGRELSLTVSIGAVLTARGTASAAEVLRTATVAATRARERGGARAELATHGMRRRLLHAAEIEQGLRRALTDGELRLHYQPIIDLESGTITAVEAFVRWQHPEHGLLAPAQFLAAADASGLAVPLGAEILSLACRELAGWQALLDADGRQELPSVHVNVSARHFAAPGLAGTVLRALQAADLAPERLVLEIAETMFTGEGQPAMAQIDDLRSVGVRIALDRFGTGYSSLAAVRALPFDALKVDASLLSELAEGSPASMMTRDVRLFEAIVGIGCSLGLPMTAAKVETEQQLRLLRSMGLTRAQGELFAPALSSEAALELMRSRRSWKALLEATEPGELGTPALGHAGGSSAPGGADARPVSPVALLSLGQAAQALQISTKTVRRWADDGRLGATRTAGGHRRFDASEVRRLLAERGRPQVAPAQAPPRALPGLEELVEAHGAAIAELSWRGLYGELQAGFFVEPRGRAAAERWIGALASAAATANYEMLHQATCALMREAERGGTTLLERHLALERCGEAVSRALVRRSCPREEVVAVRRLFAFLVQRQLADAG